jgi:hypothetical protein
VEACSHLRPSRINLRSRSPSATRALNTRACRNKALNTRAYRNKALNTHSYLRACLRMSSTRLLQLLQLLQYACCSCCSCCVFESMPRHVLNTRRLRMPALRRRQLFASKPLRTSSRLHTLVYTPRHLPSPPYPGAKLLRCDTRSSRLYILPAPPERDTPPLADTSALKKALVY